MSARKVILCAGAAALTAVGAAVVTGFSYATAGDRSHWSVRFMEETRVGKWINGRITVWALNDLAHHLSDAERERFVRDDEEMCQERA